ncbi:MAG: AGE family epimerase/isomerase [Lachnospiraceae bacterium]|nr:AGE family epimerase/isomerase [Lachnospiraceae bacterium]
MKIENLKYRLDTEENRAFLHDSAEALLAFGKHFPSPGGGSFYLGDDGMPLKERSRETWITSRMVHVYSIGAMMGYEGAKKLAAAGLWGLTGELQDSEHGGFYAGRTADGGILPGKQCYAHAFVILAACSAYLAGIDGAEELLQDAIRIYDERFWNEEEGMAADLWDTEFSALDPYRGLNANMHSVEAFLAVADTLGDDVFHQRAGRIIDRVLEWAKKSDYRIPEHFSQDWKPEYEKYADHPDDPFKPYGATPGHGMEWARLIVQWCSSSFADTLWKQEAESKRQYYIREARRLFDMAYEDAWNADGAEGFVYTTDWSGKPVVRDRMHWTLAEGINTAAVLYRKLGEQAYADAYEGFMRYLDACVMDHERGSWYHQLDAQNRPKDTVWPGKPDLYHAFQAMLIPYGRCDVSIAKQFAK